MTRSSGLMRHVFLPIHQPGTLRVNPLLNRTGVDVRARLERLTCLFTHPCQQSVEAVLQHVVIVVAPGAREPARRREAARQSTAGRCCEHRSRSPRAPGTT